MVIETGINHIQYWDGKWVISGVNSRVQLLCIETGYSGINNVEIQIIDSGQTGLNTWQLDPAIDTRDNPFPISIFNLVDSGLNNHIRTGKWITGINTVYPPK